MNTPVQRRPRTSDEHQAVLCLQRCTFPVASWDKRFVRALSSSGTISEKEAPQLWRLFIKYRRQIGHPEKRRLMDLASSLAAPDLRKLAAAQEAQAQIDRLKAQYVAASSPAPAEEKHSPPATAAPGMNPPPQTPHPPTPPSP